VIKVPPPLSLSDGRMFLEEGRPPLLKVIEQAKRRDVPVHTMIRLGRNVSEAILKTTTENASDMILFGWPGTSGTNDKLFGSVIDRIVSNPPADIAILRARPMNSLRRIIVPVAGGSNSRLSASTARALALASDGDTKVVLVHVAVPGAQETAVQARANNAFRRATEGMDYPFEQQIITSEDPVDGILEAAEGSDMIVIGATKEPMFRNLLMGNVSHRVADLAECPVLIVKRRSPMLQSMLRETILQPVRTNKLQ
jgi:nucleotide-binding universal stress UspA family protein